jgi:hypothetical protein
VVGGTRSQVVAESASKVKGRSGPGGQGWPAGAWRRWLRPEREERGQGWSGRFPKARVPVPGCSRSTMVS